MLVIGDCRETMRRWIAEGVRAQMCVTSPPYWGLRDYGTARWDGGDATCSHQAPLPKMRKFTNGRGEGHDDAYAGTNLTSWTYRDATPRVCGCGAKRIDQQLGLEPTIAEYVANMVEVFRLVRDVLADDGVLWLNLGDSYSGSGKGGNPEAGKQATNRGSQTVGVLYGTGKTAREAAVTNVTRNVPGLEPKQLCGIPWRVAFALQADGWWLRQDIIWSKPNPMPESVTDRCTKAHEYLFLLAKSERYFYDAAAIAEPSIYAELDARSGNGRIAYGGKRNGEAGTGQESFVSIAQTRNRRSVWEIATQPYAEAHFATFPRALVEPCIMAGSRVGDTVLDPFMGSGTVGQVAQDLGRKWLGCELSPDYGKLAGRRTAQLGMVLA